MKIRITSLLLFLLCFLPVACTMANKTSVDAISPAAFASPDSGVVLLSTGAPQSCVSFATFLKVFEGTSGKKVDGAPLIPIDSYTNKSDFSDHHGTVNAVLLPPGNYYVSPWMANPYVTAKVTPKFAFEVKPGETTYAGELFMTESCGTKTRFVVQDRYNRDLEIATQKNPAVTTRKPVKRLMQSIGR